MARVHGQQDICDLLQQHSDTEREKEVSAVSELSRIVYVDGLIPEYVQCHMYPCFVWHTLLYNGVALCVYEGTFCILLVVQCGNPMDLRLIIKCPFPLFQDQKEQVKQTSQRLTNIFAFLECTLLRGRVEKREKKRVQEGESSNIQEAREEREVVVEAIQ